jgi:hypothetical protein
MRICPTSLSKCLFIKSLSLRQCEWRSGICGVDDPTYSLLLALHPASLSRRLCKLTLVKEVPRIFWFATTACNSSHPNKLKTAASTMLTMALRGLHDLLTTANRMATSALAGSRKVRTLFPLLLDQLAHHLAVASNMNYALELSLLLEKHLAHLQADEAVVQSARSSFEGRRSSELDGTDTSKHEDEGPMSLEDLALQLAIEEVYESTGSKWKPWASM